MKTFVSNPSGYCKGVERAIDLALSFKEKHLDKNVYVLGNIVHNEEVSLMLKEKGIISLTDKNKDNISKIKELEDGCALIFSAHGHDKKLEDIAKNKNITILDATCPIVNIAHKHINEAIEKGYHVIYIGKNNHPEASAALAISPNIHLYELNKDFDFNILKDKKVFVTNQTTFSMFEIKHIFNKIKENINDAIFEDEICNATKLRQKAIFNLPKDVDCVFVIGGKESSNTKRLYEIANEHFITNKIYQIVNINEIDLDKIKGCSSAAIISGASTPLMTTNKVKEFLDNLR